MATNEEVLEKINNAHDAYIDADEFVAGINKEYIHMSPKYFKQVFKDRPITVEWCNESIQLNYTNPDTNRTYITII